MPSTISHQPVRLYTKGVHMSFTRSNRNQSPGLSVLKIQGVESKEDTAFYLGKRVVYVYRARNAKKGKVRTVWGRVTRSHGNSGAVRAKFAKNLPPKSLGATVRVMLYPSRV
mmetsp:Transcript_105244/g.226931  ORF Transcript_105244/g.226931 Transcript_105244/m.226931 type:complete len:112 (-) Transcript_105244:88-423(-)